MNKSLLSIGFLLGVMVFNSANAHLYWVEPNEFYFYNKSKQIDKKVSEVLTFEFTGGDTYFNADTNRAKDDEESYNFNIIDNKGNKVAIDDKWQGKTRAVFEAGMTRPGTYVLEAARVGKPMYYTKLKSGDYLHKAADELTKNEQDKKEKSVGYYQGTKAYTTLHKTNDTWKRILGHPLEITPLSHPNLIDAGDTLDVKLLFNGKPLAGTKIKIINQNYRFQKHGDVPIYAQTDESGIASIKFPDADRYLITTEHNVPLDNDKKAEGLNYSASLMLQVNEPWVKEWAN